MNSAAWIGWIDALGYSLVHFLWQGAAIGAAYFLLRPLCATMSARYRLGMAALMAMSVAPPLTLLWLHRDATAVAAAAIAADFAAAARADALTAAAATRVGAEQLLPWLVALWLIGVAAIATRSFLHWRRLAAIVRAGVELPRDWQLNLIQMRQRFGILRPVRLLASLRVHSPMLIGWFKPVILLPASLLTGFAPAQIELIIAHELSHVRRFDYVANLVQIVIETLLFYHPIVHWISRDVRQAREQCCDDLVLMLGGGNAIAYARTLADLEELQHDFGSAVPALGIGGGELLARIRRIVDPAQTVALDPLPRSNGALLPLLVVAAGLAVFAMRLHLVPAHVADVVAQLPVRGAAWMSGNASLAPVRAALADAPAPAPVVVAPAMVLVDSAARPRIAVAAPTLRGARSASATPTRLDFVAPPLPPAEASAAASLEPGANAAAESKAPAAASVAMPAPELVVPARYPQEALLGGVTGKVDLDFRIAADGSVRDVRVLHAHPTGVFEQSAIAALRQWRFAASGAESTQRYARSFAFARSDTSREACRAVTGSHICRKASAENEN